MGDTSVQKLFLFVLLVLIIATAGGWGLRLRYGKTEAIVNFQISAKRMHTEHPLQYLALCRKIGSLTQIMEVYSDDPYQ